MKSHPGHEFSLHFRAPFYRRPHSEFFEQYSRVQLIFTQSRMCRGIEQSFRLFV